jgi:pyrroloquinoline quinone biosynthesis protein B
MTASLRALVLGAAAGGGLPQWNCGCANCTEARKPDGLTRPQSQSSIAVSAGGEYWAILNASPDIRDQLAANPVLHPRKLRDNRAPSVLCTNGDVDHIAGLLVLREKQAFTLYATEEILSIIRTNPLFGVLDRAFVTLSVVFPNVPVEILPGVTAEIFPVPGKVPLYLEGDTVAVGEEGGNTVGVAIRANGKILHYVPGCARMTNSLAARFVGSDAVFFDGTVFTDDEMITTGAGQKTGKRMGHMAMMGEGGSIEAFARIDCNKKIYIHINNTNPVWNPHSQARRTVEAAGWQVAHDGMEVVL